MAERQTPDPRRDGGERRQASPTREGGYSSERRQATPTRESDYSGERRQSVPREGGERRQASPTRESGYSSERRQAAPTRESSYSSERRQSAPRAGGERPSSRRSDVIRCENCGEDYSITYKRCPFCDERPGRGGVSGRRVANTRGGGYGRPVNPMQVVWLVISLILIISALFIVFRFIGSPLFGGKKPGNSSGSQGNVSSSQGSGSSSADKSDISTPSGPDTSTVTPPEPQPPAFEEFQGTISATGGLNVRSGPGKQYDVLTTAANGTSVTVIGEEGDWYQIRYNGSSTGYVSKEFVGSASAPAPAPSVPTPTPTPSTPSTITPTTPSGTVTSGTRGTITGASTGLNIRSGPGTEYSVVASAANGASVTIQGEENGWYKIIYNGSNTGYVSKDFVSIGS